MDKQSPWEVSQKTKSFIEAENLLPTVSWIDSPEQPINLINFLTNLHKVCPFNLISLNGIISLNLKIDGGRPKRGTILKVLTDEIQSAGNEIENINLDPTGFTLLISKKDDDLAHVSASVYRDEYTLIDLHVFDKDSILDTLSQLTN
jgi:hypothetical protein